MSSPRAHAATETLVEAEKQLYHIKKLRHLEFLSNRASTRNESYESDYYNEFQNGHNSTSRLPTNNDENNEILTAAYRDESLLLNLPRLHKENQIGVQPKKTIDMLNHKISKLETNFSSFDSIKMVGPASFYEVKPDAKTKELILAKEELESKQKKLFAGIYSMKSFIYFRKTNIPLPKSTLKDEDTSKIPKLVELYQYLQSDSTKNIILPHGMSMDDIIEKTFKSILVLKREPSYKKFLQEQIYTETFKYLIHDTFWWCFLERYQKLVKQQEKYFVRVSNNYVKLLFTEMNMRYRDKFFKQLADLLAMFIYSIFSTAFPQSCLTQFTDEFKEFICGKTHVLITGSKPIPNLYVNWNFDELDPPEVVFARKVLNKDNKKKKEIENLSLHIAAETHSTKGNSDTQPTSKSSERKTPAMSNEPDSSKSFQRPAAKKKESHKTGPGPDFEDCYIDMYGKSPLVKYYLFQKNAQKIDNAEILVKHSHMIRSTLDHPSYTEIINRSLKKIKEIEKDLETVQEKHRKENIRLKKLKMENLHEQRLRRENLLKNRKEVSYVGGLLALNAMSNSNSSNFEIESAFNRTFQKHTNLLSSSSTQQQQHQQQEK